MTGFAEVEFRDTDALIAGLKEDGGVVLRGIASRQDMLVLCEELGVIYNHPHSDPEGFTVVEDLGCTETGMLGFSSNALHLHTDRSPEEMPPAFVTLWCESGAQVGGESILCDGREVYQRLMTTDPPALDALSQSVFEFGGVEQAVFQRVSPGWRFIRYRLDGAIRVPSDMKATWTLLNTVIEECSWTYPLAAGQGYVINNGRILHGRRAFTGSRRMLRLLLASDGVFHGLRMGFGVPQLLRGEC